MSFTSAEFLIFFTLVLIICGLLQRLPSKLPTELFLVLASYVFYAWWDWRFCFLLLFVTITAYSTALFCQVKWVAISGIIVPLAVLGIFKYFNFFLDSFSALSGKPFSVLNIILPVGISFYTFQALSYVIDVYRGRIPAETSFVKLALYICFFPQLVAGPIVRASDFLPQLHEQRGITRKSLATGIQIMLFGLFKKLVLADHISVFVDDVYAAPESFHWFSIVLAVVSYSLQIYLDFSGYSDIAVGCAKCLGFDFKRNFNLPYLSCGVTEFWHRWHISLSTWLREYLYIPLGGNRKGLKRTYLNLFLTMTLGGLWHGASWTFVVWGMMNGIALCLEKSLFRLFSQERSASASKSNTRLNCLRKIIIQFGTFGFITLTWIFFRAESFEKAWRILVAIFSLRNGVRQPFIWSFITISAVLACSIAAISHSKKTQCEHVDGFYPILNLNCIWQLSLFFIAVGMLLCLAYTGDHPFVYFQF